MFLHKLSKEFFNSEKSGGIVLIVVTVLSMILVNSSVGEAYAGIWNIQLAEHSITHWVNDGLMAIFFLLIGLELHHEIRAGELSSFKSAALPVFGALGGMIVPASIYLIFNFGKQTQSGAGIPMATDIAFAIGILSLLGSRVPISLKIFLTALAVIDDLGAILVIAIFYTSTLHWTYLFIALGIFLSLFGLQKLKIKNLVPYLIGGIAMWYCMLHSGIHATIAGVMFAFAIPYNKGDAHSPSFKLQHFLHKPVSFLILPIFAAANTLLIIGSGLVHTLDEPESVGIICGLLIGKPVGIWLFAFIASILGWATLPGNVNWISIFAIGFLGGIGFTMSIFITLLAFDDLTLVNHAKIAILLASVVSGIIGFVFLKIVLKPVVHHSN